MNIKVMLQDYQAEKSNLVGSLLTPLRLAPAPTKVIGNEKQEHPP